jgi:hypothetical protein
LLTGMTGISLHRALTSNWNENSYMGTKRLPGYGTSNLRPILNFTPSGKLWPQGRSCPPGVNFVTWGEVIPGGFTVGASALLNSRECSPVGVNEGGKIPPRDKFHPWGPSSPLGAREEVENVPLGN